MFSGIARFGTPNLNLFQVVTIITDRQPRCGLTMNGISREGGTL